MFKSYLKITIRNLQRYKEYSAINILGLAVGLTCFLLISVYVRHELTYDRFHEKAERIYRIGVKIERGDLVRRMAWSQVPLGPALHADFPETEHVVRFWRASRPVVLHEQNAFREKKFYFTDAEVFEVFSFQLLAGNPGTALASPNSVVLTESTALRLFGDAPAIGKVIEYEGYPAGTKHLTVTGVLRDLPDNTQFDFDYLASLAGVLTEADNWGSRKPIWTYVLLADGTNPTQFEGKLKGYIEDKDSGASAKFTLHLEPLRDVHLFSSFIGGFKPGNDINSVYLLTLIGFFILLIACVNFMNLATARSLKRAKEVGLRKVLGAYRGQLIRQFLGEAILLSCFSLLISLLLLELVLPSFNEIFNATLQITYAQDGAFFLLILVTVLLVGLLAGLYPALVLSRFRPAVILTGRMFGNFKGAALRNGLVVFQFAISIVLIIGTLMVQRQMEFVRKKQLGFNQDLLVVLPYSENETPLLPALSDHFGVQSVCVSQRVPVNNIKSDGRPISFPYVEEPVRVESYIVDDGFLETYQMKFLAGRNFSSQMASDTAAFVITETAVKLFGWISPHEALGKEMTWSGYKAGRVIGVVEDFHTTSLHEKIEPVVLHMLSQESWWRTFITVRIEPGDLAGTLAFLESTWRKFSPKGAYEYFFIDESLAQLHRADQLAGKLFAVFAMLAIIIACLGLFGLAAYSAEQRNKEIGVRKVLGASIRSVLGLLSKDFVKPVLWANFLAWPIAWFAVDSWLQNFAYRVEIGWLMFVLAGGLALLIAIVTVSTQAMRAALANPVEALKYK